MENNMSAAVITALKKIRSEIDTLLGQIEPPVDASNQTLIENFRGKPHAHQDSGAPAGASVQGGASGHGEMLSEHGVEWTMR